MPTWYPGQVAVGQKVFADPVIFGQAVTMQGATTLNGAVTASGVVSSKGLATGTVAAISTPSTLPSPGTVTNTTGYDVMIYASATTGITAAKFPAQGGSSAPGSIAPATTGDYYLPSGGSIALTYTGTLTWTWLAV